MVKAGAPWLGPGLTRAPQGRPEPTKPPRAATEASEGQVEHPVVPTCRRKKATRCGGLPSTESARRPDHYRSSPGLACLGPLRQLVDGLDRRAGVRG